MCWDMNEMPTQIACLRAVCNDGLPRVEQRALQTGRGERVPGATRARNGPKLEATTIPLVAREQVDIHRVVARMGPGRDFLTGPVDRRDFLRVSAVAVLR